MARKLPPSEKFLAGSFIFYGLVILFGLFVLVKSL